MPFSYQCSNPMCKQVFESINSTGMCPTCYMGKLTLVVPQEEVEVFPAPGQPLNAPVVRSDNFASTATNKYKITDEKNRDLTIDTQLNGGAPGQVTVAAAHVRQIVGGEVKNWVILSPSKQPDWGHLGATSLQNAIKALNRAAPPQAAVYVRLGFQHGTDVHVGFGFVHILFSHNRKKYDAIAEDVNDLIEAVELRKYYTCSDHPGVHLDQAGYYRQKGKCTVVRFKNSPACGKALVEKQNPKGVARIFKSSNGRYVLTREKGGTVLFGVFQYSDATYNLVTMYNITSQALRNKMNAGDLTLLYPKNF